MSLHITVHVEMDDVQQRFLDKLDQGALILDFGCGSGRDTKIFLDLGYHVNAVDGSYELCQLASEYTGIKVRHMMFDELSDVDLYDGIWACSSILHLSKEELLIVLKKMVKALKNRGIIYTSFKYGTFSGERHGRYFTDMTEESFQKLIKDIEELVIEEQWISRDARKERSDEKWLNLLLRKQ